MTKKKIFLPSISFREFGHKCTTFPSGNLVTNAQALVSQKTCSKSQLPGSEFWQTIQNYLSSSGGREQEAEGSCGMAHTRSIDYFTLMREPMFGWKCSVPLKVSRYHSLLFQFFPLPPSEVHLIHQDPGATCHQTRQKRRATDCDFYQKGPSWPWKPSRLLLLHLLSWKQTDIIILLNVLQDARQVSKSKLMATWCQYCVHFSHKITQLRGLSQAVRQEGHELPRSQQQL